MKLLYRNNNSMLSAGISPRKLGLVRESSENIPELSRQVNIPAGKYWFGTQLEVAGLSPSVRKDGADPRKLVTVK